MGLFIGDGIGRTGTDAFSADEAFVFQNLMLVFSDYSLGWTDFRTFCAVDTQVGGYGHKMLGFL